MDMHEWALAEAVSSLVFERVKKPLNVSVKLGELQSIDEGIFLSALNELIDGAEISLERENVCCYAMPAGVNGI